MTLILRSLIKKYMILWYTELFLIIDLLFL